MQVATFTQHLGNDNGIDYRAYLRRISKYDIDRNVVDLYKLNKDKERDRKENVKIKKEAFEMQRYEAKRKEVFDTKIKIE